MDVATLLLFVAPDVGGKGIVAPGTFLTLLHYAFKPACWHCVRRPGRLERPFQTPSGQKGVFRWRFAGIDPAIAHGVGQIT